MRRGLWNHVDGQTQHADSGRRLPAPPSLLSLSLSLRSLSCSFPRLHVPLNLTANTPRCACLNEYKQALLGERGRRGG